MRADVFWLSLGILLLVVEIVTGGFWIGFFGVGGVIAAGALWSGLIEGTDAQIAVFLIASVLPLIVLRRPLMRWLAGKSPRANFSDAAGQTAVVVDEIPARGSGRVSYQGTTWDAESEDGKPAPVGVRVRIVRQDGIRLYVRAE
ncbi:MAG TPA: NfeD family protein [Nitrospiria bacterium]|nr:NfeD family protein [Nitrospiria bacterium]